jgi:hypothetical protein
MKLTVFSRCALSSCAAVALPAGCGGSQPPIGATGITVSSFPQMPISSGQRNAATRRDYKASAGLLYVALSDMRAPYDEVNIYNTKGKDPSPLAV